jgi:hypothetical protein
MFILYSYSLNIIILKADESKLIDHFFIIAREPKGFRALLISEVLFSSASSHGLQKIGIIHDITELDDLIIETQHLFIQIRNKMSALYQFVLDVLRRIAFELVMNLVLKARPEIHRNSPYLNLYLGINNPVGKIYRNSDYHVIALISARLRKSDIVLDGKNLDILLMLDHVSNTVYIG